MTEEYCFHFDKGVADFQNKNYAASLKSFSKCIQLDRNSKPSYLNHGVICNIKRIHEVAYQDFSCVLSLDHWELIAYFNRFISSVSMKKYEHALNDLYIALSLSYVKLGVMRESVQCLDKAITLVSNNCQSYLCKGMIYAKHDKLYQAQQNFTKAIEICSDYKQAISQRAAIYRKQNLHQKCEQDVKYLLQLTHQQQLSFTLIPTIKKLPLREVTKQIQIRYAQFIRVRDEIFNKKQKPEFNVHGSKLKPIDVFTDVLNLPSLHTHSLLEGDSLTKSFDKQNQYKDKLLMSLPKFGENNSNVTDNTQKQIQINNKSDFYSFKTHKSKPGEIDSIDQQSENDTDNQIKQNLNSKVATIDASKTALNLLPIDQKKQSLVFKENHSLELNSQVNSLNNGNSSLNNGSLSKRSKIQYSDLEIEISGATLKRDTELFGSMSPYCVVSYAGQIKKTSVAYYSGRNPVWNHVAKFKILDSRALINFKVFDKQFFKKDDLIGQSVITIYQQSNVLEVKYQGEPVGNIFIKMKLI